MPLLTYEEAIRRLLRGVPPLRVETVPLHQALGRVLASPISADTRLPPFRKSFMDGYALRAQDVQQIPARLKVVSVMAAGAPAGPQLKRGEAIQIMTGAPVPRGADAVQMVEKTRSDGDDVEILEAVVAGAHIAEAGSEVRRNQTVLEQGVTIGAQEVAVLATFGHHQVEVYRLPSVSVIATGDELVEIEETPGFGKIRNSNAHMLWAQCRALDLRVEIQPIAGDDPQRVRDAIQCGMQSDLIVFSGGVSMGEFDYVHKVLTEEGIEVFFHKVAIKPGKPLLVGTKDDRMVFGLPGNPVSSFLTFELFAKPAILKWSGKKPQPLLRTVAVLESAVRHKPGRLFFKPARVVSTLAGLSAMPVETRGSADIVAFARANALMILPATGVELEKGATVSVLLMPGRVYYQDGNAPQGSG